jgi:hypothetical protein
VHRRNARDNHVLDSRTMDSKCTTLVFTSNSAAGRDRTMDSIAANSTRHLFKH